MIVLLDNQDSFVYNLVDALRSIGGHDIVVYRNTVSADTVLAARPDLIVLSPGPGYPVDAGSMMEVIEHAQGRIPILGICLGYQALIEHFGGRVRPCGPEHGTTQPMRLTPAGRASMLFDALSVTTPGETYDTVSVARYHSLGATSAPGGIRVLAWADTEIGEVIMAAETDDGLSIGLQFHPESILTPGGPVMLERCVSLLLQKGADHG